MNRVRGDGTFEQLSALPETTVLRDACLSKYTRFGIGGPADLFAETRNAGQLYPCLADRA